MVEIGRREIVVPSRREPPRAIVEALAGDVDIVAVEDAMDEAGGHVARGEPCRCTGHEVEQAKGIFLRFALGLLAVELFQAIADEGVDVLDLAVEGKPLEGADADVAVAQAGQDGGARRRGLIATHQFLAGLEQGEGLRRVDAQRFEHLRRQHLADAALQRQAAVCGPAVRASDQIPWCRSRAAVRGHREAARR